MTATDDAAQFLRSMRHSLCADPVVNNVMLSLLHQRAAEPEPGRYWTVAGPDRIAGAVFQSPLHYPALVSPLPREAIPAAVAAVLEDGATLPGVAGDAATAARFAGEWTERTRSSAVPTLAQRIYEVTEVRAPTTTGGARRLATTSDHDLLVRWFSAFVDEIGDLPSDPTAVVERRVAAQQVWLWEDGAATCFAAATESVEGVMRIGPVYTPLRARGRGYASALVGELSSEILDAGSRCILYADLNNATSNAIYRALGYRAVEEVLRYRFD